MMEKSEGYWIKVAGLLVHIVTVSFAGIWATTKWAVDDFQRLEPQVLADTSGANGLWLNENHDTCSIGIHWQMENRGQTPLIVEKVRYQVFAANKEEEEKIKFRSASSGHSYHDAGLTALYKDMILRKVTEKIHVPKTQENPDTTTSEILSSNGTISRDITFRIKPKENPTEWFKSNRLTFLITADVKRTTIENVWCPRFLWFCPDENEARSHNSEFWSSLRYFCKGDVGVVGGPRALPDDFCNVRTKYCSRQ